MRREGWMLRALGIAESVAPGQPPVACPVCNARWSSHTQEDFDRCAAELGRQIRTGEADPPPRWVLWLHRALSWWPPARWRR
jgi:hypothetical protein